MQDILTYAATAVEVTIALFTVYGVCTQPSRSTAPAATTIEPATVPPTDEPVAPAVGAPIVPDPWEELFAVSGNCDAFFVFDAPNKEQALTNWATTRKAPRKVKSFGPA